MNLNMSAVGNYIHIRTCLISLSIILLQPLQVMAEPWVDSAEPVDSVEPWEYLRFEPGTHRTTDPARESERERAQTDPQKPNILLILVDDLGWQDTSVPFHTVETPYNQSFRTPHMDRLASSGVRFSQAYSASPVCTPTRVSIMTGRHPARSNVTNWTLHNSVEKIGRATCRERVET